MTHFMRSGDAYLPTPGRDSVVDSLPVGNYTIGLGQQGFFYVEAPAFPDEGKTYGTLDNRAERIMTTYLSRGRGTGVLLAGEKGSGKTRLARTLSRMGASLNMPTILLNEAWHGDPVVNHLRTIDRPFVCILDEFEKVYNKEDQESLLTMLDGTMTPNALFILTVNNIWSVSEHMKNRPGRLFYNLEFGGLEADFIRDYCADKLDDQGQTESVLQASALFDKFNFDMLKALIEEMNRYKESPFDALEMLNAKPVTYGQYADEYDATLTREGIVAHLHGNVQHTPLNHRGGEMNLYFKVATKDVPKKYRKNPPGSMAAIFEEIGLDLTDKTDASHFNVTIKASDVTRINADAGLYEFVTEHGTVLFTKKQPPKHDVRSLGWSSYADD